MLSIILSQKGIENMLKKCFGEAIGKNQSR